MDADFQISVIIALRTYARISDILLGFLRRFGFPLPATLLNLYGRSML